VKSLHIQALRRVMSSVLACIGKWGRRAIAPTAMLVQVVVHAQTTVEGQIPGVFSVSESGAATYRIPLQVPPGIAGMVPKLALVYSSQGGNGLLGMGWSIDGFSAISRCPRTLSQDSVRGSVNYDIDDRFCLDGQRLMLASGSPYGAAGTEYRTERESFSKIVASGSVGNGPEYFTVQTKSGLAMQYGVTADSRIEAQGKAAISVWALNHIADSKGNYITVAYTEDAANGSYYPSRIDYAGNSVRFTYVPRPDDVPSFNAGSRTSMTQRLYEITTFVADQPRNVYRLGYQSTTQPKELSRVLQIEYYDYATNSRLLPTEVIWSPDGTGFVNSAWNGHAGGSTNNFVGDFDGDGKSDMAGYVGGSNGIWDVCLSTGAAFSCNGWQGHAGGPENNAIGDFNGDGRNDMAGYMSGGNWHVCLSTGAGFNCSVWAGHSGGPTNNVKEDFDGDGRTDMAGYSSEGNWWHVCLSTGNGFSCSAWTGHAGGTTNNVTGDFNGDGKADMAGHISGGNWHVCLSTGSGFACSVWAGHGGGSVNNVKGDFNADGLTDIAGYISDGNWDVCLSTGNSFTCSIWAGHWGGSTSNVPGDFNGDGKSDMAGYTGSNGLWDVCLSIGTAFNCSGWSGHGGGSTNNALGDFNGDGKADMAGYVPASSGTWHVAMSSSARSAMTGLREGAGQYFEISEAALTDSASAYNKDSGESASVYPKVDLQGPLYVVAQVQQSNGVGGTKVSAYQYRGLKAELGTGRGMLGFREARVTNLDTGLTERTQYLQDWPYTGFASSKTVLKPLDPAVCPQTDLLLRAWCIAQNESQRQPLVRSTNTYTQSAPGSLPGVSFPYLSQSVEESWDLNGATLPTVTTNYQYGQNPQYGDPTQVQVTTGDGSSKTTINEYLPANTGNGNWILGRLKKATVTSYKP
jgi:hypothetical protein